MKKALLYSAILISMFSCNSEEQTDFGEVRSINTYENTKFAVTLEDEFDADINSIYAPTLGYCWEEIRNQLSSPISNITSEKVQLLHDSKSFQNVLEKNEYQSSITIDGDLISAKAEFKKSLPFIKAFKSSKEPILFNDEAEVPAFEFEGDVDHTAIRFYDSDENFAIALTPMDISSRIILMKTDFSKFNTLKDVYEFYQNSISKYNNIKTVEWKRRYTDLDFTKIPKVNFNIKNDFPDVVNTTIESEEIFKILKFYQRNAFILNENGAKVESEAELSYHTEEHEVQEKPQPKNLIFNSSFIIFLKKTNSAYPYFMVYVTDLELLDED